MLDMVIEKKMYNEEVVFLIDDGYNNEVRIAIMTLNDKHDQQVFYLTKNEFTEICEKFLERK
jgi:hypothetical protein